MMSPENWQQTGTVSVDDAVNSSAIMFNSWRPMIGMIIPYGGSAAPDGTLACDGAAYNTGDYPDLYAVIGTSYGNNGAGTFRVPDLRGRTAIGAGTGSGLSARALGDSLGEESHTLTTTEIPSHSHSIPSTLPGLALEPGELPVLGPLLTTSTGNTGGDGAHNNMQPSVVINYVIVSG